MAYGESNGHVTDGVMWPWKVKSRAYYLEHSWRVETLFSNSW